MLVLFLRDGLVEDGGCLFVVFRLLFGGGLLQSCWLFFGVLFLREGLVEDGGCLFVVVRLLR